MTSTNPDLESIREHLRTARGPQFWRSLDQLADAPAFRELVEREFPRGAGEMADSLSRRNFLKLMGASLALAGVSACTYQPREKILPFSEQPQGRTPGIPNFYASAVTLGGFASGVLVRSNDGRPTKIEGNPLHPSSLGATDVYAQAEILTMYDPDRSTQVLNRGAVASWADLSTTLSSALQAQSATGGATLRILTGTVTSPTMADQLAQLQARFPQSRWYQYEPINRDNVYEGALQAFGQPVHTRYNFADALVVLALDADFLAPGMGFLAYAREFAASRRVRYDATEMARLYVVEPSPSNTGITADNRLPLKAAQVAGFTRALAARLGVAGVAGAGLSAQAETFLAALTEDLEANRGRSLVIAGDQQPPEVHALAHALNAALGNVGTTVIYSEPVEVRPTNQTSEIAGLANEIAAEQVEVLLILGGNPAYDAPGDLRFAERLGQVPLSVHLSLFVDETSTLSTWHVPAAHFLESWSDARGHDGTASIVQPLIEPLYGGKTSHEVLAALLGQPEAEAYTIVRAYWEAQNAGNGNFEAFWQGALASGVISGTAASPITPALQLQIGGATAEPAADALELVFRPDPAVYDGRYANNGWLQELPRPITKMVWDNALLMSPRTAIKLFNLPFTPEQLLAEDGQTAEAELARQVRLEQLTAANGRVLQVNYRGGSLELPLWLLPGHAEDSITVNLGYGRTNAGRVGDRIGVDVYPLRTSDALWFGAIESVRDTGRTYPLVSTQDHWTLEGRDIYRVGVFEEFKVDPKYISKKVYKETYGKETPGPGTDGYLSLQPGDDYTGRNAWGMSIDLTACIGCNACVIACQSENNIPVVGKDQVAVGREMHWIRIDRYFAGDDFDNPDTYVMPMACMQCEKAPCELVCPVAATVHDYEGLNNMVYNRCVGTKYCSNNCPYKVRRFNFLQYTDLNTMSLTLARNPEVTVRNKGVMEKCTYCVQRISDARIAAKKAAVAAGNDSYVIEDGAIATACEAVCPTEAIVFGDINDTASRVAKVKAEPHAYGVLGFLNVLPRTSYLARVRNPNEELVSHSESAG